EFLAGRGFPHLDHLVVAGGSQQAAVRAEGDMANRAAMTAERQQVAVAQPLEVIPLRTAEISPAGCGYSRLEQLEQPRDIGVEPGLLSQVDLRIVEQLFGAVAFGSGDALL